MIVSPHNQIARFKRGQTSGSIAPNTICIGQSLSSLMFLDQFNFMFNVDGSRGLNNKVLFASFIASSIRPLICHCRQNTAVKKNISFHQHEDGKQVQATNKTLPIPTHVVPDLKHPPVSPQIFYLRYYLIYSSGACGVSAKVDVIPGH